MKTSTKILLGLLLVCLGVIFWLWKHPKTEKEYVPIAGKTPPPEIVYSNAKNGNQVATFINPKPVLEPEKAASEDLLNTVKNINELENAKIIELTKVVTELKLQLTEKNLAVNDAEKQVKMWKDKFNEVTVDNANNTVAVKSDVSPIMVEYEKRPKWYKSKVGYVSITSENPSIVFNGVEKYEAPKKEVKDIFELTFDANTGNYVYNSKPKDGIRFYDASLNLTINPDGKFRPYVFAGTNTYNLNNYAFFYGVGFRFLLLKY